MESTLVGSKFLLQKYSDLHSDALVERSAQQRAKKDEVHPDSLKKEQKVDAFLERLKKLFTEPNESVRKRNIHLISDNLLASIVISEENFPESYIKSQQRLARERGYGDIHVTPEMRETIVSTVQSDQAASFEKWIQYLTSNDAPYPAWFKYYVLRSVSKLHPYDKVANIFTKRSKSSTKLFPEINAEALSFVYESLTSSAPTNDDSLKQLFESADFAKLYAHAVRKQMMEQQKSDEKEKSLKGEWKKYAKGSDPKPLVKSLEGMGTGWCTVGESTARTQLQGGDFYVYYSANASGEYKNPRIAIRMDATGVAEVRGINPHQELEPEAVNIAYEKVSGLPGGSKYEKRASDMNTLTIIEDKVQRGQELSVKELDFLFEIHKPIEGFGRGTDPRISLTIDELLRQKGIRNTLQPRLIHNALVVELKKKLGEELTEYEQDIADSFKDEQTILNIKQKTDSREELTDDELKNLYSISKKINHASSLACSIIYEREIRSGYHSFLGIKGYHFEKIRDKIRKSEPLSLEELKTIYDEFFSLTYSDPNSDSYHSSEDQEYREDNLKRLIFSFISSRDKVKDLSTIHNLPEEQVVDHEADLNDETVIFVGDLKLRGFVETLPPSLKIVYGNLDISESHIHDLANLTVIKGSLLISISRYKFDGRNYIQETRSNIDITSLGNLERVEDSIYAEESELEDLGKLSYVGGELHIYRSQIDSLDEKYLQLMGADA